MDDDPLLRGLKLAMTVVLVTTYGIVWCIAALPHAASTSPQSILATVSLVTTLPYFLMRSCLMFAVGALISFAMIGLGVLIPPLGAIFAAICIGLIGVKLWTVVRNVPFVLLGMALYRALDLAAKIGATISKRSLPLRVTVAFGLAILAVAVVLFVLGVCRRFSPPHFTAAVMFGFAGYIVITLIFLIIPGFTGDMGIDGDTGDFDHH